MPEYFSEDELRLYIGGNRTLINNYLKSPEDSVYSIKVEEYDNSQEYNKNWVSQDEILEARKVRTEKKKTHKKIFS